MGELLAFSQSSLLLLPHTPLHSSRRLHLPIHRTQASLAVTSPMCFVSTKPMMFPISYAERKQLSWRTRTGVISDSKVPTTFTVDSAGEGIDVLPDSGGSDDNFRGGNGGNGGNGGHGGNGGNNKGESGGNEDPSGGHEKKAGMSMSQKLTLGYAALVGIGGVMGYLKGGSTKSLMAGGASASLLYIVYTLLPSNPVLASCLGLILSASLLGVMGSRFKKSGKIFPAGIVSIVSLVMSGGYLHGILRSLH
ncbi:putative membrane protein [Handroanthus impetiginosus]|uniref:Putative membrane protein n=1 Tax=Handroanthus impetiginosus TaxID=429701 RepID=A0A2G9HXW3_9LAMI|nr:putative membrane protein [Handroanthus impetiginosus]